MTKQMILNVFSNISCLRSFSRLALWAFSLLFLYGCGAGGGGANSGSANISLTGVLIDGPIQGARVFLDINGNLIHDEGEPLSELTGDNGAFKLDISSLDTLQLASAMLVSDVPADARDADDAGKTLAEAGKQPFTMIAPASAFLDMQSGRVNISQSAVVSPLTTLVAGEILSNGLTLDEARVAVKSAQSLEGDPLDNFIASKDATTANIARATAVALGQARLSVANVVNTEGAVSARDQAVAIVQTVRDNLPAVLADLGLNDPVSNQPTVAELISNIEGTQGIGRKAAEQITSRVNGKPSLSQSGAASPPEFYDYVVVFKDTVGNSTRAAVLGDVANRGTVLFTYTRAVNGFAVRIPATASEAFLNAMANNPNVDYVEADAQMSTRQVVQNNPTWGLDRVDQRNLPLNASYSYNGAGAGVRVYVIDTGILASHVDFGGRVLTGYSAISDANGTIDCNGHGTHVAGTIGGAAYGVAKGASLVPVRVLDCAGSGALSGVIAGIDWAIGNAIGQRAVFNMSLGGGASTSLDSAVAKATSSGITVVAAAGNDNANACNYSPAREPSAITVGATTSTDARASYSNFGSCLDLFAPGSAIISTWYTSTTATNTLNGTSMATPHVAGLAALIRGSLLDATPTQVADLIKTSATPGKVSSAGSGSPNLLLYTLFSTSGGGTSPSTVNVSVASIMGSASLLRNGWQATVTISVKDASGSAVGGASVSGSFSAGGSSVSCITATNGSCSVRTGTLGKNVSQTTYTVSKITGTSISYDASNNAITSLTIRKP